MSNDSIFRDEFYENLDFISKIAEPFICERNEILQRIPETLPVNPISFNKPASDYVEMSAVVESIISDFLNKEGIKLQQSRYCCPLLDSFVVHVNDKFLKSEQDFGLKKQIFYVDRKDVEHESDVFHVKKIRNSIPHSVSIKYAINDIGLEYVKKTDFLKVCDVFNIEPYGTAKYALQENLRNQMFKKINTGEWRVKTSDAVRNLFLHTNNFLQTGDSGSLAALAGFMITIKKGLPVYTLNYKRS